MRNEAVVRCRVDDETDRAIELAAERDDRSKADWMRAVLKRELRSLGLLKSKGAK